MRSGELNVADFNPSAALSASSTEKPWISKPARRNRLIFGSSSIRRTTLLGLFIGCCSQCGWFHRGAGQDDGSGRSLSLTAAEYVNGSTVRLDEGRCDPKAQSGSP